MLDQQDDKIITEYQSSSKKFLYLGIFVSFFFALILFFLQLFYPIRVLLSVFSPGYLAFYVSPIIIPFLLLNLIVYIASTNILFKKGIKSGSLFFCLFLLFFPYIFAYVVRPIQNNFNQDYREEAVSKSDVNFCNKMYQASFYDLDKCYTEVVNVSKGDIDNICEQISSSASASGSPYSEVVFADSMKNCWTQSAINTQNPLKCDNSPDKDRCLIRAGSELKNPNFCNSISNESLKESCILFSNPS